MNTVVLPLSLTEYIHVQVVGQCRQVMEGAFYLYVLFAFIPVFL